MSYCRFQNTLEDLRDCEENIDNMDLSERENWARVKIIQLCKKIVDNFDFPDSKNFDAGIKQYFTENNREEE
jgi:hypothetical protein